MFEHSIISRNKRYINVKCGKCSIERTVVLSEFKRTCKRQMKYGVNAYMCPKCIFCFLPKNEKFKNNPEWSAKISKAIKKMISETNFVEKVREGFKRVDKEKWKQKVSKSMKEKFTNDLDYKVKISKARKKYWENDEYRALRAEITNKQKIAGTGMFGVHQKITKPQRILYSKCEELNLKYIIEHKIGFYRFDCFLPDHNILIECNGEYYHKRRERNIQNDMSKTTYIKEYFPQLITKTIWENEFLNPDKICDYLLEWTGVKKPDQINYDFNDVLIKEIENIPAVEFIQKYHYTYSLGHGRSQIRYGAFHKDKLIAIACFANATRNESVLRLNLENKQLKELVRLCCHPQYQKKNFMSWFLSHTTKRLMSSHPLVVCILTFADSTFGHQGIIYKACGWKFDGYVPKSYWYVDKEGYVMHKKTLYNHARKMKIKESTYAIQNGYNRIWGKKKLRYIKYLRIHEN